MRFILKRSVGVLIFIGIITVTFLIYANDKVSNTAQGSIWRTVEQIPFNQVGVVPGTRPGGMYFQYRINAAAELYRAGKVKWLIVSGDNRHIGYNEPREMQRALIEKGIPRDSIYCDYAGFTTLDSVVRAREVFGQTHLTVISQQFQNQRAIYLGQHYGIDAIGFNAKDVPVNKQRLLGSIREFVARGRAVLDATLIRRQPHFSGPAIIPGKMSAVGCEFAPDVY